MTLLSRKKGALSEQHSPPTAEQVAQRAFALAAVVCRSGIEQNAGDSQAEDFRLEVLQWLKTAGVASNLEPQEHELLRAPLGTLPKKQEKDMGWRAEGLGVLAWALNRWELTSFNVPTDAPAVAEALGFKEPEGVELLKNPALRPQLEREELARGLYLIHIRLRQAYDRKPAPKSFLQLARDLKVNADDLALIRDDLAIDNTPLTEAPEELVRYAISTVVERHRAANWLLGDDPVYSKVSYALRGTK